MGLFGKSKPKQGRYEKSSAGEPIAEIQNSVYQASDMNDWLAWNVSSSGLAVTEKTAMMVSAVYACVSLIGGAIAALPKAIYERTAEGRQKVDHKFRWLLNEEPNPNSSAAVFWECMTGSLLLHGDAFAIINRPSYKLTDVIGFEWIPTQSVDVILTDDGPKYRVHLQDGKLKSFDSADILHIPGPGFNGFRGMSQIQYVLRQSVGIALAADEYSANFFQNGARPDFVIKHPTTPTVEQQDQLRNAWAERYQGVRKSHRPAILTGGADIKELTMNAEDAQLITTREFQVEDISRIFGVPPHLIGHTKNNTSWGTGIEQMSIGFVKYTLSRHLVKIEQELNRKIWPSRERYFVEFVTAGLERGDYKTRNEGYRIALGRAGEPAWMTTNEVRKLENLAPIDGGDQLFTGIADAPTQQTAGA